ncbi:MAG: phosphatidylserine decarboxylase, partial [Longimicrobiales bacterium]
IDGALGRTAVVAVGAYNVGRISAAFDPLWNGGENGWVTNRRGAAIEGRSYTPPIHVTRGDEIMAFHLGSTVVLLFESSVTLGPLSPGGEIRLGAPIAVRRV